MVRHAPIHRRSGHSDIAICCGRNARGSSPSTSVVPLSNQVTTLNHKRFKGLKMFSDGHLGKTSGEVITETGQKDPLTRRIYASYIAFWGRAKRWADLSERGYLNARALKFPYGDKA